MGLFRLFFEKMAYLAIFGKKLVYPSLSWSKMGQKTSFPGFDPPTSIQNRVVGEKVQEVARRGSSKRKLNDLLRKNMNINHSNPQIDISRLRLDGTVVGDAAMIVIEHQYRLNVIHQ